MQPISGENKFMGSLPAFFCWGRLLVFVCFGNLLEGTLPGNVMASSFLAVLDISRTAGQVGGLRGQLPQKASQASHLKHFMISHQSLEGCIPPLIATLSTLALYSNRFNLFRSTHLRNDSVVLVHTNLLTCSPPACGDVSRNPSVPTLANRFSHDLRRVQGNLANLPSCLVAQAEQKIVCKVERSERQREREREQEKKARKRKRREREREREEKDSFE